MRRIVILLAAAICAWPPTARAQGGANITSAEPFKLGTFEMEGEPRIGIVLKDALVVDLAAANRALERNAAYPTIPMPGEMRLVSPVVRSST